MKRTTMLLAAMAALTLASCSKNEVNEGGQSIINDPKMISFNSSTGLTRAAANGLTQVQSGFTVVGLDKDNAAFIAGDETNSVYSFNSTANTWTWSAEAGKEWPGADKYPLTFYAEYPQVDMSVNSALNKAIEVKLDMTQQNDLLVAKSEVPERPISGFADLSFKHILSNLVFKIETLENYKVVIQSIRVVNTAKSGRTFDYATMAYEGTEPAYGATDFATTDGTYKTAEGFFYTGASFEFTGTAGTTIGTVPAASGIMMQMPQLAIPYWTSVNGAGALAIFQKDAKAWEDGSANIDAKLTAWYGATTSDQNQPGMSDSEGWKGARIEVIYRIYDTDGGKSIIGRQKDEAYELKDGSQVTADADYFVRVGYPLDLSAIKDKDDAKISKGWEMSKRYTYTIQMGTPNATNGTLLEPAYKAADGSTISPAVRVDNPESITPGNPVTPGLINFNVVVTDWIDNDNGTEIL